MYNPVVFVSHLDDLRRRKALAERRDISLRAVAKEAGLALSTVQKAKDGPLDSLNLATIQALCRYFGVKRLDDLIEWRADPASPSPERPQTDQTQTEK